MEPVQPHQHPMQLNCNLSPLLLLPFSSSSSSSVSPPPPPPPPNGFFSLLSEPPSAPDGAWIVPYSAVVTKLGSGDQGGGRDGAVVGLRKMGVIRLELL